MRHRVHKSAMALRFALVLLPALALSQPPAASRLQARLLVSRELIGKTINENDARASLVVWAGILAKARDLEIQPDQIRLVRWRELEESVRAGHLDALGLTVREYSRLRPYLWPGQVLVDERDMKKASYQVVVHGASGISSLADLKGKSMVVWDSTKMALASEWLAALLAEGRLGTPEQLLGRISWSAKVSGGAVLPVFFRQLDACLVSAQAMETLYELNPQLRQKLRVLAVSPPLVVNLFAFHKDLPQSTRERLIATLAEAHHSAAGRQALTLFQGESLVSVPPAVMDAALELLQRSERVRSRTGAVRP